MLSLLAQTILTAMISIIPPGKSVHSRTRVTCADKNCLTEKVCSEPSILCAPAKFSPEIYDQLYNHNLFLSLSLKGQNTYVESTKQQSYTVAESYQNGLKRYSIISIAIEQTVKKADYWSGSKEDLAAALVTVFGFESGFREDIHSGRGPLGRGDCKWKKDNRSVKAFTKGAMPIPGSCRSVCLGQINIGGEMRFGYQADDLVGTDLASTLRCAEVSARMLARSKGSCGSSASYKGDWVAGMFAAYGTGGSCRALRGTGATLKQALWPEARAARFYSIRRSSRQLNQREREVLGL